MTADQRAGRYLASLRRWTQRLRQFAEKWDRGDLDVRERQAFPLEWDNAIDRLVDVEGMARDRQLDAEGIQELRRIAGELTELLPTMRRLRLRLPDAGALERARIVEAA
jgi:hypothetical protein